MPATHLLPLDGKDSRLALTILLALFMGLYGRMSFGLTSEQDLLYPASYFWYNQAPPTSR
jgi:hypothetical protein